MSDESLITKNIRESKNTNTFKGSMYINKGDFVFLNTVPNRLYIEGGYVDIDFEHSKGTYNYYIHDNQGSVRAVVDENGTLVQATDYSAMACRVLGSSRRRATSIFTSDLSGSP